MFDLNGTAVPMDAVYKMRYTFRSSDSNITLKFAAHRLEPLDNESWGTTNIEVSVDSTPAIAAKSAVTTPHRPTVTIKAASTATRSAVAREPIKSTRKAVSTNQKLRSASRKASSKKISTTTSLHEKKKPLTP
jgi:hypothetical protein